ncbi:MAG: hypothetical protein L0332_16020 [Chloroflexi bacterium]|nr:hypothetical protein [Chloroflexota bacterium]MCI0580599.1 hypothetical protein [Chloroflexota bacterium]MCI0648879.1 hypothetical protein [Chloroflexota bacterium]MCI0728209.1 hypothetical protein [Chloroflexota bacterium]
MITQQADNQSRRLQYVRLFTIIAAGLVVVSGIHFSSILTSGPETVNVADTIYHLVAAVGFFICSRLVKAGKREVIYLLGVIGIIAVLYAAIMGRGFNPIMILIDGFFIWQMLNLSKAGELT